MQIECVDFHGKIHLVDQSNLIDRLSVYGVFITENQLLLIQDPRSLRWELPGGGVESGETIRQGLVREFIEETGASIIGNLRMLTEWTEYFFDVTTQQAWRSKRKFYMVSRIEGELLASGNGDDSMIAKLIHLDKIKDLSIAKPIREVIELASSEFNPGFPQT